MYPNIISVRTINCSIYKEASIGALSCNYYDQNSDIMSLDSFDGFSGESISLEKSNIINMNKNVLHLNNIITSLNKININYELFFLTTSAPNLKKIEINGKRILNDKDLIFISGFYNLESIKINAILSSYNELQKLEKLRELRDVFCLNERVLEKTKNKREKFYKELLNRNLTEKQLQNYLMHQQMIIQNQLQDLLHKLYVPRLERVKWENKIYENDIMKIKEELIIISNMQVDKRKNIAREKKEYTLFDSLNGLDFDYTSNNNEDEVLVNSNPFSSDGIDYYVKRKKLILLDE